MKTSIKKPALLSVLEAGPDCALAGSFPELFSNESPTRD